MLIAVLATCVLMCTVSGDGPGIVAFSASFNESQVFETDQLIKFPKVHNNFGNAFNNDTGVFTASKTGLYFFSLFAHAQYDQAFCFRIFRENTRLISVCGRSAGSHAASGNAVLSRVKSGEKVFVRAFHKSFIYENSENTYSSFNGYLVSLN
ncbi:unnamed protein product [Candidula unifasciata]|uniref:C1q domain-containing protein n=1 Tax=Candidula unifasciata TaxID=100452 RepID=A0A8S3ZWT7_9EUPU|nr:unnamed protein product [Candidula unifasciata]